MKANILPIQSHVFRQHDRLLFDANIWLHIHGRQDPTDKRNAIYSRALRDILQAGGMILVDVLVLSEFINRYARIEYEYYKRGTGANESFKSYRQSRQFKPVATGIANACRLILKQSTRTDSRFESADLDAVLTDYESQSADFNDRMLTEICKYYNLAFVTHDADFRNCGLTVLTANAKML